MEQPFKALQDEREALKVELRTFGSQTYIFDGGVVMVGEPEVRSFVGQRLVLDADKAKSLLPADRLKELIDLGVIKIEDVYSRNAVAKVEVKLA